MESHDWWCNRGYSNRKMYSFNKGNYKDFCLYGPIFFSFPSNYQSILYRSSFEEIIKVIEAYDLGQHLFIRAIESSIDCLENVEK